MTLTANTRTAPDGTHDPLKLEVDVEGTSETAPESDAAVAAVIRDTRSTLQKEQEWALLVRQDGWLEKKHRELTMLSRYAGGKRVREYDGD